MRTHFKILPRYLRTVKRAISKMPGTETLPVPPHVAEAPAVVAAVPLNGEACEVAFARYKARYAESIESPETFWSKEAKHYLSWFAPFSHAIGGSFLHGDVNCFTEGKLNVSHNCIDRHVPTRGEQAAIVWESDEVGVSRTVSYAELGREVSRIANAMKHIGVRKGDVVTLYMPMIPELAMAMLACTRIGAVHSVVFAGFSADALRDRVVDCKSHYVFTANEGKRGGRTLALKEIVDEALRHVNTVRKVVVFERTTTIVPMTEGRDVLASGLLQKMRPYCPPEWMDSEDPLFILYTSGSTGKPKGVEHNTAGYLLHVAMTTDYSFNVKAEKDTAPDVFCCVADCGWITGHSYTVYGPLCLGATTVMFESVPTHPDPYRYWDLIERHRVTQFYTAPTAIRALMRHDPQPIKDRFDLSSLRVLGSVGEPINPEAWSWYREYAGGNGRCSIVDTYWQTETGGHLAAPLPGAIPSKPGSCTLPYFGIKFAVLDAKSGEKIETEEAEGVLCIENVFPSIARTVHGDHDRYLSVYMRPYPGYYFTGDGCRRDKDGYYWITGRVDDVINPSGHRIGTAEIESALVGTKRIAEAAVIGFPHAVKGEGIGCFVQLKTGGAACARLTTDLKHAVRHAIGPFATPDFVIYGELPKTRSGKIMRRILRKIAAGEEDSIGDVSTLADPAVVDHLISCFKALDKC